jgi:Leucine-rich repeat (LRR) protein
MAEALLSAFLGVLFDRLASGELLNFARQEGLEKKLEKWSKMLLRIEAVLDDAEEKQENGVAVKRWLDDLRDLAYDADDILDEFATEALRQKLTGGNHAGTSKVWNFIPACCTGFTPSAIKINMRLGSEMEEITARFNEMVKQKDDLKLSENVDRRRSNRTRQILAPTSVVTEAHVYGREKDKEALLELVLGEKGGDDQLSVIPIIGMGGIGKTTLSQLVYNDEKVKTFFDVKAWACVSEDFDAVRVTKTILQSFTSENCEGKDLDWLQTKLKENLKGKKFFVVLDDLWNENYHDWSILRAPFEAGAPRSTIIITTRNKRVSSNTGTIPAPFSLKELSNDVCLSILAHHALGTRDFSAHLNLKDIGEEIVKRCKGSPLAAKVLGGVLRSKMDHDEWEDVLKNKIWDLPEVESEIAPALMLSYHHLPSHLKRCFAYCSVLPKDYLFQEKHLVLLWMAEGLLQRREGKKRMEDLGSEYFRNLLSRSFFQQSFKDESQYLMHDLINDLAQRVAGDICFKMEDRVWDNNRRNPSTNARHLSYLGSQYDGIQKFEVFNDLTCLRTFLPLMLPYPGDCNLTSNVLLKLIPKLRRLRALSLNGYQICELPESIGDLKHLRFLDLSHTKIRSLPNSVATLYNLQTMILEHCSYLKKLPSTFGNLVNLRHLNIRGANALEGMPPQMGKLTCLQSLSNLVVGKGICSQVKELGPLLHLRETLCISGLENVTNHEDARDAKLFEKHNLYGLSLEWGCNLDESQDRTSEFKVLNMLQPHKSLKELTVRHYGCAEFPTWLKVPSFSNMVHLEIESFAKCTLLPSVGQLPSLKHLLIKGMASVTSIGRDFCGDGCLQPFRSLETLHFGNMQEWENWIPCEEIPKLRKLSIERCPKLVGKLPNLPLLENIVINECKQLVISISSFPENCNLEIEGSKGVINSGKVEFGSLRFKSLSTVSEFTCRIEGLMIKDLTNVEDLTIETCEELAPLWSNDVGLLQNLPCLRLLKIYDCSKLISLVAKEVEEQLQLSLPSKLRKIEIINCKVLKSLPKPMMHVEDIRIWGCTSLTYFAISQLPPTLKRLRIRHCTSLRVLVDGDHVNSCSSNTPLLESLYIDECPSLISLTSTEELPATLKDLVIWNCKKLESIAKSFHHNSSLEFIQISSCENLKSLPMGIQSLSHLRSLVIWECGKFQVLPNCILNLTSLQSLMIRKCPSIFGVSISEVGFPTNLTSLYIGYMVSFNEAFFEWGLYKLTSLKELSIYDGPSHLVSFPEMMLPASLTNLTIEDFPNLECLSSKDFQGLASLEKLNIRNCEKLTSFPEHGFSPSLLSLTISNCPLLKEHCKKDRGPEWLKIAHIPRVKIDSRHINEPEEENQ